MKPHDKSTSEYAAISLEETCRLLDSSPAGLDSPEVRRRIELFGYNEIAGKKRHPLADLLRRYWGPMPWLLELAMVLASVLRHIMEGLIIFVLLTINAVIGHMHSRGSQRAIELLQKKLAPKSRVLRDGEWVVQDAREVVPGDVIAVRLGDIVPADARILEGELSVDQSVLTGESLPTDVQRGAVIYSGSVVRRGEARCIVVNTGPGTYFGKTAELVRTARPKSHQEEVMMAIVKYMMVLGMGASILVSLYALIMHIPFIWILTFTVIFLMGAVPVALPAVLTIVQSAGAMELSKKGVLVTNLDAIEDAASVDVLCLDKTGTITQNSLSVSDCKPFQGHTREEVITLAALASQEEGMDVIDLAIIRYAESLNTLTGDYRQVSFTPFHPSLKRTEAVVEGHGDLFRVIKGASQIVVPLCRDVDAGTKREVRETIDEFSRRGYRTIAVARSEGADSRDFRLLGLMALEDPPRPDAAMMIEEIKQIGIRPVMLTGDNAAIAREIALRVGIGGRIVSLADISGLSEDEQVRIVGESDGIAEIYPEDKFRIVQLLQSRGHMVGMTGDGVNDAPALKQAEMGIAVSNATDVAKASASVVLTEPGIGVIVDAVKISRKIYQRMLTWVINKVTKVIEFVGLLTVGFFWFHDIVLSLLGMSLLVFANDFVTMALATDNVESAPNPNKWNVRNVTLAALVPGVLLVGEGVLVILGGKYWFGLAWEGLQTLILLNLVFNSQFRVLIVRERRHFWSSRPGSALLLLSTATLIGFALFGLSGLFIAPLDPYQVAATLAFSAIFTLAIDFPKYSAFKRYGL